MGARLGLVVLVVSCHWALGVRLGLFLPVFACLWALGVRVGLFPPVFRVFGSSGFVWVGFLLVLHVFVGPRGPFHIHTH